MFLIRRSSIWISDRLVARRVENLCAASRTRTARCRRCARPDPNDAFESSSEELRNVSRLPPANTGGIGRRQSGAKRQFVRRFGPGDESLPGG